MPDMSQRAETFVDRAATAIAVLTWCQTSRWDGAVFTFYLRAAQGQPPKIGNLDHTGCLTLRSSDGSNDFAGAERLIQYLKGQLGDGADGLTAAHYGSDARAQRPRFQFESFASIMGATSHERWLVRRLVPKNGLFAIYGKWKTLKSFIALDLALAVARGVEWAGRKTAKGPVIYVAAEGGAGVVKRLRAYAKHHGLGAEEVDFHLLRIRLNFGFGTEDRDALVSAIKASFPNIDPAMIVIDTLARSLGGESENAEGMTNFTNCASHMSEFFDCMVVAVHHEGHGGTGRMRGYSVLPAAIDLGWRVVRKEGELECQIDVALAKDVEDGVKFKAKMVKVNLDPLPLAEGEDGEPEVPSSLVVEAVTVEDAGSFDSDAYAARAQRLSREQDAITRAIFTSPPFRYATALLEAAGLLPTDLDRNARDAAARRGRAMIKTLKSRADNRRPVVLQLSNNEYQLTKAGQEYAERNFGSGNVTPF